MNIKLNLDLKNIDEEIHKLDILDRDTIIQLYVLSLKRIDRLNNIINELKKWLNEPQITYNLDATEFGIEKIECVSVKDTLNKIKELENGN